MKDHNHIKQNIIHQILQFIPHSVTGYQKDTLTICEDFIQTCQSNPDFLTCIVKKNASTVWRTKSSTKHPHLNHHDVKLYLILQSWRWSQHVPLRQWFPTWGTCTPGVQTRTFKWHAKKNWI